MGSEPVIDLRTWDLCFIDLEATGHVFGHHEIVELALIRTTPDARQEVGRWYRKLRPRHPERITPKAREISGYSDEGWRDGEAPSAEIWKSFAEFARGAVPVCHNPTFDRAHITLAAAADGVTDLGVDYHWIGTESLSWPLYKSGSIPKMSLETLCRYFQIEPEPMPHTAMNGAEVCLKVYTAIMREWQSRR
ncbi:MAG: 3'-5' exonuclease [Thermoanaerobaculia bacterium]